MEFANIIFEVKEGIAVLTLNRPDKLNALNDAVLNELISVFHTAAHDDNIRAIIVTGAGEKSFVAGADISELVKNNAIAGKQTALKGQLLTNLIEGLGKPVIAAVNGFCLGGGCEIALACTVRLCSENAVFGQPEVKLGIIPGYGGTQRLPRIVGKGVAAELILTGKTINANEAFRIGLVNKVVKKEELLQEAEKLAKEIMLQGPLAVKFSIEAINKGLDLSLPEGLNLEANLFSILCATEDMKEGLTAFLEKRKPSFKNK